METTSLNSMKQLRFLLVAAFLVTAIVPAFGFESKPKFKAEKTSDSPSGGGKVYAYRGGGDGRSPYDKISLSISEGDWKNPDSEVTLISDITIKQDDDHDNGSSQPDGYKHMDRRDGKDGEKSVYILHMYYFAKPNTGYEFEGWYKDAAGKTKISGSTDHYPLPGVSGTSSDPNKYYYSSKVAKPGDNKDSGYTPATWNNGEKGKTPAASGSWNDGEFFYLRDAFEITKATADDGAKIYVKFRVKPRAFELGGTGSDEVSYTASGYTGSVGKTSVTATDITGNITLTLSYNSEKYTFNGWYWAEGDFKNGTLISTEASTTYTMVAARGLTSSDRVHIWPDVKRKSNPVAEVTYNSATTTYESWGEAIAAAKATGVSGATITLYKDVADITEAQVIDRDMTLDLNGHTFSGTANYLFTVKNSGTDFTITNGSVSEGIISFSTDAVTPSYAVGVQTGAKLILEGGKIYANNTKSDGTGRGVEISNGGTLEMTGGTVESQALQNAYAIINRGTATIGGTAELYAHTTSAATAVAFYNVGTSAEINGGNFRAYAKTTTAYAIQQDVENNTLTISNATARAEAVTSTAYALARSNGTIVVNSGKYNAVAPSTVAAVNVTNKAQITLQGGIYRTNTSLGSCCASGYGCYELNRGETWNEGYRYEVLPTSQARNFRVIADGTSSYFTSFADLNTFINESSSPVIQIFLLVPEYTVPAGNYTLPSVATMLVPYNFECTAQMKDEDFIQSTDSRVSPSVYRKLIFASGVNLNALGDIEIGGYQNISGQHNSPCGAFTAKYGELNMSAGSKMTISGKLYAHGLISGKGEITVKSGAVVYESFIITDYKGGSITTSIAGPLASRNVFPISQYYIQNVQAPMTLEYGATLNTITGLTASGSPYKADIKLVGTSGAMFNMSSGSTLKKEYDTTKDRQVYTVNGNASLNDISLSVAGTSVNSSEFTLPLTNNLTINVNSGTTTLNCQQLEVSADAKINIASGATVNIASGKKVAVIDYDEWGNYPGGAYIYPLGNAYAPYRTYTRSQSNMQDARIYVKGTLLVNGSLYTSASGAQIYSDNEGGTPGGKVILASAAPSSAFKVEHVTGTSSSALVDANISTTAAQLYNSNGTYTSTAGAGSNTTFEYCDGTWMKGGCITYYTITWKSEDGTSTLETDENVAEGSTTSFGKADPTKTSTAEYTYTFDGWTTGANGGGDFYAKGATPAASADATYYAHFSQTPVSYTLSWVTDGDALTGDFTHGSVAYGTSIVAPSTPTKTGYTFAAWTPTPAATMPAANTTYTATWTPKPYTITFNSNGGSEVASITQGYETPVSAPADPTKTGYDFAGWDPEVPSTMPLNGTTCVAQWTPKSYTITFNSNGGTEVASITQGYKTPVSAPADPTKTGYDFAGWDPEVPSTMPLNGTTCVAQWTLHNYTISYNLDGGSVTPADANPTSYTVESTAITLTNPTKSGYTFDGWTGTGLSGATATVTIAAGSTGDRSYTATWHIASSDVLEVGETHEKQITINSNESVTTTIVHADGKLNIEYGKTLTTTELILEASESTSGEIIRGGNASGEFAGGIDVPSNAYFDLTHTGGFKARTWYAVAVPWEVFVPTNNVGGVYLKKGELEPVQQILGTTFDLIFYDGERRAAGENKAWTYVEDYYADHTNKYPVMEPGVAYMIYLTSDADVIRFKKRTNAPCHTDGLQVTEHDSPIKADKHWNGIANPATYHARIDLSAAGVGFGQVYSNPIEQLYSVFDLSEKLVVGQPVFVQVPVTSSVAVSTPSLARRRAKEQVSITRYDLMLAASDADVTDRVIVRMDENKTENEYVIGQDLVKMGVSNKAPQMWIDRYGEKMCVNTVAGFDNTADYPLGIFAPKNGEYDLFIDDQPNDETMLYLTYDGEAIWNLSYGGYVASLNKGTDTHYGLRIAKKAPQITTGIEETTVQNGEAVRKVLVNDKVYIIRNGEIYSVTGQKAK